MKKIALLFTILCIGALNGMEPAYNRSEWKYIPPKEKPLIFKYLRRYDNLDAIVCAFETDKKLNKVVNDVRGFTALVSILAEKFPDMTISEIADKFNTPTAREYQNLGTQLLLLVGYKGPIGEIAGLIKQGADVNFYSQGLFGGNMTPLILAISNANVDIVKLLLDSGANPYFKHPVAGTSLNLVQNLIEQVKQLHDEEFLQKLNAIKALLEK